MRRHAIVIRLGAREWSVRPLTVMQVQAIEPVLADASRGEVSNLGAAVSILRIALMRDHPEDASTRLRRPPARSPRPWPISCDWAAFCRRRVLLSL